MKAVIYINGKYYDKDDAKISVYDHGFLYGDGIFEGIRIYNGKVFKHKEHIDRLYESARSIQLEIPLSKDEMLNAVNETVKKSQIPNGYIRLIVSRGKGGLGLDPRKTYDPQVIIIVDNIQLYPEEYYTKGLEVITAATRRNNPAAINPRIKSLNYLNNILAKLEAIQAGCIEAVMLNDKGEIAECTGDNIFIVSKGNVYTPPLSAGALGGITRSIVLDLCKENGINAFVEPLTRYDLHIADEMFLTGSAAELIPVVKFDNRVIGDGKPGAVFKQLLEKFRTLTRA